MSFQYFFIASIALGAAVNLIGYTFAGVLNFISSVFFKRYLKHNFILILNERNGNNSNKQDSTTEYCDVTVARRKQLFQSSSISRSKK